MILLAAIGCLLFPGILQQPTVTLSQDAAGLKVAWTAPLPHLNNWVGVILASKPDTDVNIVSTWWKYLPEGAESGTFDFPLPLVAGEYEVRYFAGNSGPVAARSPKLTIMPTVTPMPPGDPPPGSAPIGEPILYFEITYADGSKVEGPTSDSMTNLLYRYQNSALFLGVSSLRVWRLNLVRPTTPADVEIVGTVRSEIP